MDRPADARFGVEGIPAAFGLPIAVAILVLYFGHNDSGAGVANLGIPVALSADVISNTALQRRISP